MNLKVKEFLSDLIRLIIAFVFILSSIEKLKNPFAFALAIDAYGIFPDFLINFFTLIIPWLELFIGFGLIFKFKLKANLVLYFLMILGFTFLVLFAIIKGLNIECGCYGESSSKIGFTKLLENILLMTGCLFVYFSQTNKTKTEN